MHRDGLQPSAHRPGATGQDLLSVWVDYEVLANVSSPIRYIRSERTGLTALISVCALGQRVVMLAWC